MASQSNYMIHGIWHTLNLCLHNENQRLMPIAETLYNASRRTSNQIYMLLIVLLILSQDFTFNASIHKMILPDVPRYKKHLLLQTSLGSLMVMILIRTVQYNLSKLRDVHLQTTCLATSANMAPLVHRLSAYASQRLVRLFYMLWRKYNKLEELRDDKLQTKAISTGDSLVEDMVVYGIMHWQEVFQPFKNHPRFSELLENIYNARLISLSDGAHHLIFHYWFFWHCFISSLDPAYNYRLYLLYLRSLFLFSRFSFNASAVDLLVNKQIYHEESNTIQNGELNEHRVEL